MIRAVASGRLHRVSAPVHVTASVPRHHRPPEGVIRLRARNLGDDDRAIADGIPVTSVARTLLDLASKLGADQLRRALAIYEPPIYARSENERRFVVERTTAPPPRG